MSTTIKYFGANSLAKLISLIKGMKVSDFTNDAGYITSSSVPTKVSDLTNDSGFVTSSDVPTKVSDLTNDSGFITSASIPAVPTKTSDLTNDSGFITSASIPTVPTKTSDLTNDSGFIDSTALSSYFPKAGGEIAGRTVIDLETAGVVDTPGEQPSLVLSANDLTLGTAPSSTRWWGVYLTDHTQDSGYGGRVAAFETQVATDGKVFAQVNAAQYVAGKNDWLQASVAAVCEADGTKYATAPTPATADDSNKIATTEWARDVFLPLAGGTMTGGIVRNGTLAVGSADSASISIHGGTAYANGGAVVAYGKTNSGSPGWVRLHAQDANDSTDLILKPNGTFTVGGATIAKISDLSSYLPLSGGTMTGAITRNGPVVKASGGSTYTQFYGGTDSSDGAYMILTGANNANYSGAFVLRAVGPSDGTSLLGEPGGALKWGGIDLERVHNTTGKYIKFGSGVLVCWGIAQVTSTGTAMTFGASFKDNSEPVVFTCSMNTATTSSYSSRTATGFTLKANSSSATWVSWLAIGRWK